MTGDLSILTLDLGTQCGWALCGPAVSHFGDRPWLRRFSGDLAWGTLDLDRGMRAAQVRALDDFLGEVLPAVDQVVREMIYKIAGRPKAAEILGPMADTVDFQARLHEIESWEVAPSTARKHFLGKGRGKRDEMKEAVQHQCQLLGWDVADDNQADALCLMDYARACFGFADRIPLMAGANDGRN